MLYLLVRDEGTEREVVLSEGSLSIGRLSSNDIVLAAEDVSREHAELRSGPGGIEVRDLGASTPATLRAAGADRDGGAVSLSPGDWHRMRVGDVVTFGSSCHIELRESMTAIVAPPGGSDRVPAAGGRIGTLVPGHDAARLLQATACLASAATHASTIESSLQQFVNVAPRVRGALAATGGESGPRVVAWVAGMRDATKVPPPLPLALADEALQLAPHDVRWTEGSKDRPTHLACRTASGLALVLELESSDAAPPAELVSAARTAAALIAAAVLSAATQPVPMDGCASRMTVAPPAPGASTLFPGIIPSAAFRTLLEEAARVAAGAGPILVAGETGVGKELIARFLHAASGRSGPFVEASVGALSPALVESELFGHVRGAFTDATRDRAGLLEQAHRGTLFLDEIGEVPLEVQHKLLRALQERTFRRVGGNETTSFDALIVAATNRDLLAEVRAGRFREDLYYRLNMMEVRVPPLRERPGDVAVLADATLRELDPRRSLDVKALDWLVRQPWPGNVRQLRHVLARAVRLHDAAVLRPEHLGATVNDDARPSVRIEGAPLDWREAHDAFERAWCELLWTASAKRMSEAARLSGLDRSNVRARLRRHGLGAETGAPPDEG